jgi:hypothetical protein
MIAATSACSGGDGGSPTPTKVQGQASSPATPPASDETATTDVRADNVGRRVVLKGWALDREAGAVLRGDDGVEVRIADLPAWPEGYYRGGERGKRLRVTGTLDHGEADGTFQLRDATW